jgi:hypothetical protein
MFTEFADVLDDELYWNDMDAYYDDDEGEWADSRGGRHTNGSIAFDAVQSDYDGE